MAEPIVSRKQIEMQARAAASQGVPLDVANPYPLNSIARFAFSKAYASAKPVGQSIEALNPGV